MLCCVRSCVLLCHRRCGLGGAAGVSTMFRSLAYGSASGDVLMYHIHPSSTMIHSHPSEYVIFQVLLTMALFCIIKIMYAL